MKNYNAKLNVELFAAGRADVADVTTTVGLYYRIMLLICTMDEANTRGETDIMNECEQRMRRLWTQRLEADAETAQAAYDECRTCLYVLCRSWDDITRMWFLDLLCDPYAYAMRRVARRRDRVRASHAYPCPSGWDMVEA